MTVNSKSPVTGPLVADGVNNAWAFDFKVREVAHLHLKVSDADGSNEELITSGITIAAEYLNNDSGGYAVYSGVIAAGRIVYAVRAVPYVQQMRIGNQGQFWPQTHEDALDYLSMQVQQVVEMVGRAPMMPIGTDAETLAGVLSHINRLYNSADAIDEVAANTSNISEVAAHIPALENAVPAATAAANSATAAANSATAAANSATAAANSAASVNPANFYTKAEVDGFRTTDQNAAKNASNLTTGTMPDERLPARLRELGQYNVITDCDAATKAGVYSIEFTGANKPTGEGGYIVTIPKHDNWLIQYFYRQTDVANSQAKWKRYIAGSAFSEWKRVYETAEEVRSLDVSDKSEMQLMSRVTNESATDWASYINQAIHDMNAASGGRGGVIRLPNRDIPISQVTVGTTGGIRLAGAYQPYWEGGPFGSNFVGLASSDDMFVVGSLTTDTQGFTIEDCRIDASLRTDGKVFRFSRVRCGTVRHVACYNPWDFAAIYGGIDVVFTGAHCEAYRGSGLVADSTGYRLDRLKIFDSLICGAGTESALTSAGPALRLAGNVETVDVEQARFVKANRAMEIAASGGNMPRFVHMNNVQMDYVSDKFIYAPDVFDLKMLNVYANTTLHSAGMEFGANAQRVKMLGGGISGAYNSAITFAGKSLKLIGFDFQDWNRALTGSPCIDLVSGFGRALIEGCTIGEWGAETSSGGGAGTFGVRINSGSGIAQVRNCFFSSALASWFQLNGSGDFAESGNMTI